MKQDRIKALEREVELLRQVIELTKQLEELKAKQPVYVPYPSCPSLPYDPWRITYDPYYPSVITESVAACDISITGPDNVTWYETGQLNS